MARPVPIPQRRLIYRRMLAGEAAAAVARDLGLGERVVQHLMRRFRVRGEAGLAPDYRAPACQPHAFPGAVRDAALALRREHPTWGAGLIRVVLAESRPGQRLPAERTLRGWLKAAGLGPPTRVPRPPAGPRARTRAAAPHDCWQVDASERIPLADGTRASWLRVVDECSGAVLATAVFPLGSWSAVDPRATRDELRRLFAGRGLPSRTRVDNGTPWGSRGDLPSRLELWLAGLGVAVTANRPARPQDNGVAERSQGTSQRWAEPWTCADAAELARRQAEMDRRQREAYPAVDGRSRAAAYPGLAHSGRAYDPDAEASTWDRAKAWRRLQERVVPRRVDGHGNVSVYDRYLYVGVRQAGREVWVGFDAEAGQWTIQTAQGVELRRADPVGLDAASIRELATSRRRAQKRRAAPGDAERPACR